MKELEVKAMLADKRIPEQYKLGGRLSSEFLDGVEFAEQRIEEKGVEIWLVKDEDEIKGFSTKPIKVPIDDDPDCEDPDYNDPFGDWVWSDESDTPAMMYFDEELFPEVTYKNSPKKARIILED